MSSTQNEDDERHKRQKKRFLDEISASRLAQWGFTLFRTAYGDETHAAFASLLEALHAGVRKTIMFRAGPGTFDDPDKEPDAELVELCERAVDMFHIRVEDDRTALEGASLEQLRDIVREVEDDELAREREQEEAGLSGDMERRHLRLGEKRVFLVADEEVLRAVQEAKTAGRRQPWVRVVDVDYEANEHRGNRRMPQYYWGWMLASTDRMHRLWEDLDALSLLEIAPGRFESDSGPVKIWDGP
ncbi:hypothetical protein QBC47DRAFT_386954 [Echria macrotheca]|uniref:Uncharacterized protein n=1 Tax=Echria macrotheca TaxID=438768 RepID=A0AAJ0BD76_9PEZI|nr:hypothetical protein QBC47DRAFT_386954 [Echria macrotheca]